MTTLVLTGCSDSDREVIDPTSPGGNHPGSYNKYALQFDSNGDKIPDVYEYRNDNDQLAFMDGVSYINSTTEKLNKGVNGKVTGITTAKTLADQDTYVSNTPAWFASSVMSPYIEEYTDEDIEEGDEPVPQAQIVRETDVNLVQLEAGKQYTLTFHDPEHTGDYIGEFIPGIRIVEKEELANDPDAPGLELVDLDEGELNERTVSLHFMPQKSGVYSVVVSDLTAETIADTKAEATTHEYGFSIYPDDETYGHYTVFKSFEDGDEYTYSPEDIYQLRAALKPYMEYDKETGKITGYSSEKINGKTAKECFEEMRDIITDLYSCEESPSLDVYAKVLPGHTKIDPTQLGFYWDESSFLGDGISAVTGMAPERQSGAVKPFEDQLSSGGSFTGNTKLLIVDNDTKHQESIGVNTSASVAGTRAALSVENKYSKSIKYGSNTVTFMLAYNYAENNPRRLPQLSGYMLTDEASAYLQEKGEEAFRKRYGDYFIGGAVYGARYVGSVVIKTTSSEQMSELKNTITASINDGKGKFDNTFSKKLKDATKKCQIELNEITIGGTYESSESDMKTGPGAIDSLLKHYQSFKQRAEDSTQTHQYDKLTAYLVGYNQITGGEKLSNSVNIPVKTFNEVRQICGMLLSLKATAKAYMLLPDAHFANGATHKQDIEHSVNNLYTEVASNMDELLANEKMRAEYIDKVRTARNKMVDQMGRYQLYRAVEDAAANMKGKELKYAEFGFKHFYRFPAANKDIDRSFSDTHYEGWKFAQRRVWEPKFTADGRRFCYFYLSKYRRGETTKNAKLSWAGDSNPPLSRKQFGIRVESGLTRGLYLTYAWKAFNDANYKDFAWTY